MWSKTTVSYVALVTLAVIGSIAALPLTEINVPPVTATEKSVTSEVQQQEKTDVSAVDTDLSTKLFKSLSTEKELELSTAATKTTEEFDKTSQLPIDESVQPVAQNVDSPKQPKPSYLDGDKGGAVHYPQNVEPTLSLFMDFFQPFQPFPSFQPFQPFLTVETIRGHADEQQAIGQHHQQPFGSINEPNDSFETIRMPAFNKLVEAYTNEFKTPEVIIVKPKRNVSPNSTTIPPVPFLLNIVLDALRHGPPELQPPSDMVSSFDQSMSDMQHDINAQQHGLMNLSVGKEPIKKSTSKTEIVNGHKVQINETVYSNDDDNNKSFYHFKRIVVLPENMTNKKSDVEKLEKFTSETTGKSDSMNEITPMPIVKTEINEPTPNKNGAEPIPLDDHFQTAAASYYAPFAPYGPSSAARLTHYYNRPPYYPMGGHVNYPGRYPIPSSVNNFSRPGPRPAPISLHNDILVNQLAATHQGTNAVLPPDVEIIDVNEKPQMQQGGHVNYNNHYHNHGQKKFPGRKN